MGLNDVGQVHDTTTVTLYHPKTGEPLFNADGSEMTVEVYGPYSEHSKKIERERQNRRLARAQRAGRATTLTAEQLESEDFEQFVKCVKSWNLTVDKEPEEFSETNVRAVFTDHPWAREQVQAVMVDTQAFLSDSAKT